MKFYGTCSVCGYDIFVPMVNDVCPTCQKLDERVVKIKKRVKHINHKRGKKPGILTRKQSEEIYWKEQ